jgi:hypothetical protein
LHHAALHNGEDERGQGIDVEAFREMAARILQAAANGAGPGLEIGGDAGVGGQIVRLDFERQAAHWTAVGTAGVQQALAIARQYGEDAGDRVGVSCECRLHDDGLQTLQILVQDGEQEGFLAGKEVIKTAGIGARARQNLGDAGRGVAPFPKQITAGIEEPFASGTIVQLSDRSSKTDSR